MVQPYWPDRFIGKIVDLDPRYSGAPELSADAKAWHDTAAQHCRNEFYYRGLVQEIGEALGIAAYTDDAGGVHDSVLCAKVPELVRQRLKALAKE